MSNTEAMHLAHELIAAFSAGDWPRFRATLAPDLAYEETGTGRRTAGADAYVALCQGWRAAFPDASGTVRRAVGDGGVVAQEVTWTGTHTGPLAGPGGIVPASGRRIDVPATVWYTVRAGRIATVRHHLDLLTMLQQIGALPRHPERPRVSRGADRQLSADAGRSCHPGPLRRNSTCVRWDDLWARRVPGRCRLTLVQKERSTTVIDRTEPHLRLHAHARLATTTNSHGWREAASNLAPAPRPPRPRTAACWRHAGATGEGRPRVKPGGHNAAGEQGGSAGVRRCGFPMRRSRPRHRSAARIVSRR